MDQLFITLTRAVEGSPFIALSASFAWGILSIILSPCHLASLPLIIGFISGQGKISIKRAFVISSAFAVGILLTIALIGVITAAMGRMLGDTGQYGNYIVAAVFLIFGLHLLGVIRDSGDAMLDEGRGVMLLLLLRRRRLPEVLHLGDRLERTLRLDRVEHGFLLRGV